MKIIKNLSLNLKITSLTLATILVISIAFNLLFKNKIVEENARFYINSGEQALDSIRDQLRQEKFISSCDLMQKALDRELVSFFIIQKGDVPMCFAPPNHFAGIFRRYDVFDKIVSDAGKYDHKSIRESGYTATVGWFNTSTDNFMSLFLARLPSVIFGILISVVTIAIIVFRETKPIKKLLKVFKSSGKFSEHLPNGETLQGAASEIRQLWRSAYEFEKTNEKLKNEVRFVSQDAQNFLRREIAQRNEKIPYRFFSSMLRFDMNNYTKTFLSDPEATQALILKLSVEADELVHRYGGLHYAFGGDEFIVVFRDSDQFASQALAFACTRDIFLKVDQVFTEVKVTLKASISHSENVLFELPNGLFLRGLNLILSQRYLTTVASKEANKLVVNKDDLKVLQELSRFSEPQLAHLKGIQGDFELCEQTSFYSIEDIFKNRNWSQLKFFRSDADILYILNALQQEHFSQDDKMIFLTHLKSFEVCRADEKLANEFMKCFRLLDKNAQQNKTILSSLLIAGEFLIPVKLWTHSMSEALLNASCKTDSRCNSAILKLLSLKASSQQFNEYAERILAQATGPDFRSMGNFLIAKAKTSLSDEVLQECSRMLKSKNQLEIATGIYVSSQIIRSQKEVDAVALAQFEIVPTLIARIEKLRSHEDNMVSSRANLEFRELTRAGGA